MKIAQNPLIWLIAAIGVIALITYLQPGAQVPLGAPPICGDGACSGGEETCVTCPGDCGECPPGVGVLKQTTTTTPSIDITSFASKDTFTNITLTVKAGVDFQGMTASMKKAESPSLPPAAGADEETIRYISVDFGKLNPSDVDSMSLAFSVNRTYLAQRGLDPMTVKLKRFTTSWDALQTFKTGEDEQSSYYAAISPGASMFAITAARMKEIPRPAAALAVCGDDVCEGNETEQTCCQDCGCEGGYNCELNRFYQQQNIYECKKAVSRGNWGAILFALIDLLIVLAIIAVLISIKKQKEYMAKKIRRLIRQTSNYIDMNDYRGAVESYKELKETFEDYENGLSSKDRKRLYADSRHVYNKIYAMSKAGRGRLFL